MISHHHPESEHGRVLKIPCPPPVPSLTTLPSPPANISHMRNHLYFSRALVPQSSDPPHHEVLAVTVTELS